jgi:Ran GTPase-activating protein (RanGAP) involved in mRNA processing and transport
MRIGWFTDVPPLMSIIILSCVSYYALLYSKLGNQLTDRDAWYLIEAMKSNTSLTSLDLSNNNFGELGGIYLGGALVSISNIWN